MSYFRELSDLGSTVSSHKISNASKIASSFVYSRIKKRPVIKGLPVAISIEPTTSCNLRCPECPSGLRSFTRPTGMLGSELVQEVINELKKELMYITYYFQGEPYLNPNFTDFVSLASRNNIYTATSTNAHFLTVENAVKTIESGLKKLIISIDGTTQETFGKYRIGGNLEKVIEGTKILIEQKKLRKSKFPYTIIQFVVFEHNRHQIAEMKKLASDLGVDDCVFKTAQVYDFENGSDLIPMEGEKSRYVKSDDGSYQIKNKLYNHCWKMWHSAVITWDGNVVPCCFDKDAKYVMGNIKNESFHAIWNGEKYYKFRQTLLGKRSEIDICKNCSEGTNVWI